MVDDVEVVLRAAAELGEGPRWWAGRLLWVDIAAGVVHRLDPGTGADETIAFDDTASMVAPRRAGGLVVGVGRSLVVLDDDLREVGRVDVEPDRPENRLNDGRCDAAGRLWVGSMRRDGTGAQGALYRVGADGDVRRRLDGVGMANGLDWSPDGRRLYFIDSLAGRVDVLDADPDDGEVRNRRPLVHVPDDRGVPDGMTVDADGCLWICLHGGWAVRRYTPDGALDRDVRLPVGQPTACAFGGPDLADLYITSATEGLDERARRDQPLAGSVLRLRPDVAGLSTHPFDG